MTKGNYPYKPTRGACNGKKESQSMAIINYHKIVQKNSVASLMIAVAQRSVTIRIEATKTFENCKKGIFRVPCGIKVNHAVTIVGYVEESSEKYWIAQTSWGSKWG